MVELYDHQRKAVDKLRNGSILVGDVGVGKTIAALAYYVEREAPRDIVVITTAKQRDSLDWQRTAAGFAIGSTADDTFFGRLTVDSWNNIGKYSDHKDAFFIFDEQRIVGAGAWTKSFIRIAKANHWILLSATPGDTWLDYIPVFVANGYFKNRTEFLRDHVVFNRFSKFPKVDRYTSVGKLVRLRNEMLVEMPYLRTTERVTKIVETPYDLPLFERVVNDRWNVFENRPIKDVAELFHAMRRIVASDTQRLDSLRELSSLHPRLIVFYNFNYELEMLRTLGTSLKTISDSKLKTDSGSGSFSFAEWNGHKHDSIPETESWLYLVQYAAGAEGWNCIETDAMVFYSLTYSYKMWHQAHGRIDRLNTPFKKLYYYVFMSNSMIDKAIWRSLMGKKSFNETRFIDTHSRSLARSA